MSPSRFCEWKFFRSHLPTALARVHLPKVSKDEMLLAIEDRCFTGTFPAEAAVWFSHGLVEENLGRWIDGTRKKRRNGSHYMNV